MFDVAKLRKIIGMAKRFLEELRIFFQPHLPRPLQKPHRQGVRSGKCLSNTYLTLTKDLTNASLRLML